MSWRGEQGGIDAVLSGHHAIMTTWRILLFRQLSGCTVFFSLRLLAVICRLEKVYSYNPGFLDSISADKQDFILGVQDKIMGSNSN